MPTISHADYLMMQRKLQGGRNALADSREAGEQSTVESKLHEQIKGECKRRCWLAFHGSMAHRAMRTLGEPDFTIAANDGRVFFIEAKTKTGKLSSEQLGVGHLLNALNQRYKVVRSIQEFIDFVES